MVLLAPRWNLKDRGESAEAVPGHRELRFHGPGARVVVAGAQVGGSVLDRRRSEDLSSGQSTHQASAFLGLADLRGSEPTPGGDFPRPSLYPAEPDQDVGENAVPAAVYP